MLFCEFAYLARGEDKLIKKSHTHEGRVEIIQTMTDGGQMMIKDKLYPMESGSLYFINATEPHSSCPSDKNLYTRSKLILDAAQLDRILNAAGEDKTLDLLFYRDGGAHIRLSPKRAAEVDELLRRLCEALDFGIDTLDALSLLFRLFALVRLESKQPVPTQKGGIMQSILSFINTHIDSPISLDDIAGHAHIDRYYLCHLFKRETNMTVLEYIRERRLAIAKRLLLEGDAGIAEIATACGFEGISYFSRAFKLASGLSPSAFRKAKGSLSAL